jgi:hypothetical protein
MSKELHILSFFKHVKRESHIYINHVIDIKYSPVLLKINLRQSIKFDFEILLKESEFNSLKLI